LSDTEETTELVATVKSRSSVELRPQVEGQISRILVKSGDVVAEGAPLLQIDPQKQQAAFNSASAASGIAQAELARARSTLAALEATRDARQSALRLAEQEEKRAAALLASGAIAQQSYDQSRTALDQARADFSSSEQQISAQKAGITSYERGREQASASAQAQRVELRYYGIVAPFRGTVGDIPVKVGDYVGPQTLLTTVDDEKTPLEAYIPVPVESAPRLKMGLPVRLVDADEKPLSSGKVSFISPRVDAASQSVLVKAAIDDAASLKIQQLLRAKIIWQTVPAVRVPVSSVSRQNGLTFVFVVKEGESAQVSQRPVRLGPSIGNDVVVLEGLSAGEQLVTAGIQKLRDGASVVIEK
jgi:multidrug efflux pump subunit AcrA (membrane-fusion protein)